MIVVIADDLTGAAELAGIGWRFGMSVAMSTFVDPAITTDLLVVTTDTRSTSEKKAVEISRDLTRQVLGLDPTLIYKKIDSVLRGHVVAELTAQLEVLRLNSVLVVPANPHLGRTIIDGTYLFHNEPIHLSSFALDPEFPVKSSTVVDMVRAGTTRVQVMKLDETLPEEGIVIGEVKLQEDLESWAKKSDGFRFAAGASGYFSELLKRRVANSGKPPQAENFGKKRLIVSGTTFSRSTTSIKKLHTNGGPVKYLNGAQLSAPVSVQKLRAFTSEVQRLLDKHDLAIIAIDAGSLGGLQITAATLRQQKALFISDVLKNVSVDDLIVEGGSTAAAIIQAMGYTSFEPVNELAPGVVRMKVHGTNLCLTVKPGSYQWPEALWVE